MSDSMGYGTSLADVVEQIEKLRIERNLVIKERDEYKEEMLRIAELNAKNVTERNEYKLGWEIAEARVENGDESA